MARMMLAAMGQHVEAVAVGQADIDERQVERLAAESRDRGRAVGHSVDPITLFAQPLGHRFQDMTIVVN